MSATPDQPWIGRRDADRTARFDAYARRANPWMLALALAFLAVWSLRVIAHGSLSTEASRALLVSRASSGWSLSRTSCCAR